jgi:hypothetical protein
VRYVAGLCFFWFFGYFLSLKLRSKPKTAFKSKSAIWNQTKNQTLKCEAIKTTEKNQEQPNIEQHEKTEFKAIIDYAMLNGGIGFTAMKGFGKTRTLFSIANYLQQQPKVRVLIFDPSDAWLYGYSRIPVFNIADSDITIKEQKTSIDIEQFTFNNWQLVKLALEAHKDILFRLKSKSPSKRGFAIRSIINYLDDQQRLEKEQSPTHENKFSIAYVIEEFSDCMNNRLTARLEAETFLSLFNEGRNFSEAFFTCQQYEQDSAKTLRVKQISALGKLSESQKMPYHRKLERLYNLNLSDMKQRTWLIEGKIITVPNWSQVGKPYIINRALRAKYSQQPQPKKIGFWKNALKTLALLPIAIIFNGTINQQPPQQEDKELELSREDESELDLYMCDNEESDVMFPTDNP